MRTQPVSENDYDKAIMAELNENIALLRAVYATNQTQDNIENGDGDIDLAAWAFNQLFCNDTSENPIIISRTINSFLAAAPGNHLNAWRLITLYLICKDISFETECESTLLHAIAQQHKADLLKSIHESAHLRTALQYRANPTVDQANSCITYSNHYPLYFVLSLNKLWFNTGFTYRRIAEDKSSKRTRSVKELCYLMSWAKQPYNANDNQAIYELATSNKTLNEKVDKLLNTYNTNEKKTQFLKDCFVPPKNKKDRGKFYHYHMIDLFVAMLANTPRAGHTFSIPEINWLSRRNIKQNILFSVKYNLDYFRPLLTNKKDTMLDLIIDVKKFFFLDEHSVSNSRLQLDAILAEPHAPEPNRLRPHN